MKRLGFIVLILVTVSSAAFGQQTREVFGKNRLQYLNFEWKYYSSVNFDVYYYGDGGKSALQATEYLEEEFERITDIVGYSPYFKAKIFIYNSIEEMEQSNVGVNQTSHRVGGQTNFVKSYVEVANPGSLIGLKQELVAGVAELVLNDMLFGGSLTDMWQNTYLMSLPPWFVQGAIAYLSRGWDVDMDDRIRDLMSSGAVDKLNKLNPEDAQFAGQSMWNFVVQKYGKSNVNQILNLVRVTRSEEKSIAFTLGVPFKQLMLEWQEYYTSMANQVSQSFVAPTNKNALVKLNSNKHLSALSLDPSATKLAYAVNYEGKHEVYIRDLESGRVEKIMSEGYRVNDQRIDKTMPLLDWMDEKTLGVVEYKKGIYVLLLYDIETKSKLISPLRNLEKINGISFSGNGRLAALSANRAGKTDIYLLSVRRNKIRRLTNDYFDDLYPSFIPNTNTILFSSNRTSDTLKVDKVGMKKLTTNFNNFTFNLDTTKRVLSRLTNTISKDYAPSARNSKELFYLSDQKGITNLFRYSLEDSLYVQITNFSKNIRLYSGDYDKGKFAYVVIHDQKEHLFVEDNFDFTKSLFTPLTPRQQIQQAKYLSAKRLEAASKRNKAPLIISDVSSEINLSIEEDADTVKVEEEPQKQTEGEKEEETGLIDTDNYVFDKEVVQKKKETGSFLSNYKRIAYSTKVKGPFPYQPSVSADNIITSWVIDPLRGFGILLEAQMNDMLGNHKFLSGAMVTTDFKSGDVYAEYQFLKNLVDYSARFERSSWYIDEQVESGLSVVQKYAKSTIQVSASLPFTPKVRLSIKPFFTYTRFQDLDPYLVSGGGTAASIGNSYLGANVEFVYDNSLVLGQNMLEGTRFKVNFKHYESINDRKRTFDNFSLDLRHYQKIYKSLVFASRLYYGKFFGRYQHNYLLGGMDNWLFKNPHAQNDPWLPAINVENNDLYFLEHVTSLRGYDFNTFYGSDVLLANFELRIPLARILYSGPISSSFVKNFQLVGFTDVGSAWTGISPFKENNSISVEVIDEGVFEAEIQTFKSPWLVGYGVGMRSMIFGYFMKFDLAFPYQDNQTGDAKFYVTLGHDF